MDVKGPAQIGRNAGGAVGDDFDRQRERPPSCKAPNRHGISAFGVNFLLFVELRLQSFACVSICRASFRRIAPTALRVSFILVNN